MLAEALISSLPLLGAILRQVWTQYLWKASPASHMASLMALSVSWRIMIIKCSRSMETGLCLWNWPGWTQKTATAENIGLQAERVEAILVFLCGHSNEVLWISWISSQIRSLVLDFHLVKKKIKWQRFYIWVCGKWRTPGFWRQHRGTCCFELSYIYKIISYSKGMLLSWHEQRYVWKLQENAYSVLNGQTVLCLYECAMKCISENIQACVVVQMNAQVEAWGYPLWWWMCIDISECSAVNKYFRVRFIMNLQRHVQCSVNICHRGMWL